MAASASQIMKLLATRTSSRLTNPIILATLSPSLTSSSAFITPRHLHQSLFYMSSKSTSPPSTKMQLIDVDCNLLHPDLQSIMTTTSTLDPKPNIPEPLQILHHPSTKSANIIAMISPSSTIHESEASLSLLKSSTPKERNDIHIKTTVGVHPYHCIDSPTSEELDQLCSLLNDKDTRQYISCIGETGLDYSSGFPDRDYQLPWFISQLELAFEYNLPVFLHERLAFQDTLRCIDDVAMKYCDTTKKVPKIIVHCYTGTFNECIEYMKRGYYISISGYILKEEAEEVRTCLREGIIPLDRLMIETDSPYMGFTGNKDAFFDEEGESFSGLSAKKRKRLKSIYPNVPCALSVVLKAVRDEINIGREERGEGCCQLEELARITMENAKSFFGL